MTLIEDLLTENRFWTFWSEDWNTRVNVQWNGKTKFKDVVKAVEKSTQFKTSASPMAGYERQVDIKTPDIIFE